MYLANLVSQPKTGMFINPNFSTKTVNLSLLLSLKWKKSVLIWTIIPLQAV
ncbi:hypothetical protein AWRIB548_536 [Oenococcus oeni AWRIB548]|nr:hypothetical protein AWRIB422_1470 [Oenococcus oeni AWRIB422]EJO06516.1 hypothetical protein AWRIB548_536 [Oenococcus oeni AWRIB548]